MLEKLNKRLNGDEKNHLISLKDEIIKDWESHDKNNAHSSFDSNQWKDQIHKLKMQVKETRKIIHVVSNPKTNNQVVDGNKTDKSLKSRVKK